ncbi:MarR family transcriptional regulator, partial [Burkholderia multivorans]
MTTRPHDDGDFRVEFAVRFGTLWAMS